MNKCPVCNSEGVEIVAKLSEGVLFLLKCPACHWLYSTCQPKIFDKSNLSDEKKDEYLAIVQKASLLSDLRNGNKVLDIYSGDGTLLGWYLGNIVTVGIEPSPELTKEAINNKRVDFPVFPVKDQFLPSQLPPTVDKFKIITIVDVFQDADVIPTLEGCVKLLDPTGVIVVQGPYFPQELEAEKFTLSKNYLLAYTLRSMFQRVGLEMQGVEFPKKGIRAYATFRNYKGFGNSDFEAKLRLYTQMNAAIITELHARYDLNNTYQKIEDKHRLNRRESALACE